MQKQNKFLEFTLENDPQVYKLAFDFNALADAERVSGCNLLASGMKLFGGAGGMANMTANEFRGLLYASLKLGHPKVEMAEAGELLSRNAAVVKDRLVDLYTTEVLKIDPLSIKTGDRGPGGEGDA